MTTIKERIENLEAALGGLQANFSRMELGVTDKLQQLEIAITRYPKFCLQGKNRPLVMSTNAVDNPSMRVLVKT
jgi:hypothetical protein